MGERAKVPVIRVGFVTSEPMIIGSTRYVTEGVDVSSHMYRREQYLGLPTKADVILTEPLLVTLIANTAWRAIAQNLKRRVHCPTRHSWPPPALKIVHFAIADQADRIKECRRAEKICRCDLTVHLRRDYIMIASA
jgi:hypothetical protein